MRFFLLGLILSPLFSFSQNAIIKNICPSAKHRSAKDSIKSINYPLIYCSSCQHINNIIKAGIFDTKKWDTSKPVEELLQAIYKKDKSFRINYTIYFNKNGLLSLSVLYSSDKGKTAPRYFNFDLNTGNSITLEDMIKSKNDSISMRQAIISQITDSIRFIEQIININNPNYSNIIEQLNSGLGTFIHAYPNYFIMTDKEIIVFYDCILPVTVYNYSHSYKMEFNYKTLRNVLKPEVIKRLLN
jgi:hypothetical protein